MMVGFTHSRCCAAGMSGRMGMLGLQDDCAKARVWIVPGRGSPEEKFLSLLSLSSFPTPTMLICSHLKMFLPGQRLAQRQLTFWIPRFVCSPQPLLPEIHTSVSHRRWFSSYKPFPLQSVWADSEPVSTFLLLLTRPFHPQM